jgi:glycine/D-amino acid oxidase-like deaminating enzyme
VDSLLDIQVLSTVVGGRVEYCADGLPILGRLPGFDNVYLAIGHSMSGITLAPATGFYLAELITTGREADLLKPFAPARIIHR